MKTTNGRLAAVALPLLFLLLPGSFCLIRVADAATSDQPYAGLEERSIAALAPERVGDLLAGRGAGYALAAELNHYPGPSHVLQLAETLRLRPDQRARTKEIFSAMQGEARTLGERLVELEAELDRAFRAGGITEPALAELTAKIAAVEGRLRHVHLAAHLKTKAVLAPDQVARYDQLRGYGPQAPGPGGASAGRHHRGEGDSGH